MEKIRRRLTLALLLSIFIIVASIQATLSGIFTLPL